MNAPATAHELAAEPDLIFCLCCLTENAAEIRLSKFGLPFVSCDECRSRTFFNSPKGLRGYFLWIPDAINNVRKLHGLPAVNTKEHYSALRDKYVHIAQQAKARQRVRRAARRTEQEGHDS